MKRRILAFLLAFALGMAVFAPALPLPAQVKKSAMCVADVCEEDTVRDVLARNLGKRVELVLLSGQRIIGAVANVTPQLVHLAQLHHKQFHDAVIRLDEISAVIMRVRSQ